MKSNAISRHLALAASAVTAVGLAVAVPAPAALADEERSASATVSNGTLVIDGTRGSDRIQVAVGADPATLLVDLGDQITPLTFPRNTFRAISVQLGEGDDSFSVSAAHGDVTEPLTVYGGNGDDRITGGAGADLIFGGRGADFIDGARGTDTEILGRGDDVAAWLPGEGNDIVDGGRGHDTLAFVGASGNEKFDLSANGSGDLFTRDAGNIRMDLTSIEALRLATLGGADTVTLHDVHQTALREAAIDLSVLGTGDANQDSVVVEGSDGADHVDVGAASGTVDIAGLALATQVTGADSQLDQLHVNTGAGHDSVHVSDAAAALIGVAVDLGSGQ
jgi:Ca2+-binding RTX toxin-like protein